MGGYYEDVMNRLGQIENRVNSAFGTLASLQALDLRVEAIEDEVGTPSSSRIDEALEDIATLQSEVTALQNAVSDLEDAQLHYKSVEYVYNSLVADGTLKTLDLSSKITHSTPVLGIFKIFVLAATPSTKKLKIRTTPTGSNDMECIVQVANVQIHDVIVISLIGADYLKYQLTTNTTASILFQGYIYQGES
jgi:hypothetical protein